MTLAIVIGLSGCGLTEDVPDGLPPSEWLGSQGIKQPTGFEVPGCPYYTLGPGNKVKPSCRDDWSQQDWNKNGGVSGSNDAGGGGQR